MDGQTLKPVVLHRILRGKDGGILSFRQRIISEAAWENESGLTEELSVMGTSFGGV